MAEFKGEQDAELMFEYVEVLQSREVTYTPAARIKERLVYALDGLKLSCGMELTDFREDEKFLDIELRSPINEMGPWFQPLISYKRHAKNLLVYNRKEISYLSDSIIQLLNIIDELFEKLEQKEARIQSLELEKTQPTQIRESNGESSNEEIIVLEKTLKQFFTKHDLSNQQPNRRSFLKKQILKKLVAGDQKKTEVFNRLWNSLVDDKVIQKETGDDVGEENDDSEEGQ